MNLEVLNYTYYRKLKKFISRKKYYAKSIDANKMEKFMLEDLEKKELIDWIRNSISSVTYNENRINRS